MPPESYIVIACLLLAVACAGDTAGTSSESGPDQMVSGDGGNPPQSLDAWIPDDEAGEATGLDHSVTEDSTNLTAPDHSVAPTDSTGKADATVPTDAAASADTTMATDTEVPEDTDLGDGEAPPPEDPWPVPALAEEPAPTCQAAMDDPWYFQFLDNLCEEKVWPSDQDRDRMCPVSDDTPLMTLENGTQVEYLPGTQPVAWDTDALDGLLPPGMRMAVILVKRVDGVPHYRYLSNGAHDLPQQPWSTTKFLAAANAAASMRIQSGYEVGLTADASTHRIGDLASSMCLYDNSPFTSNGLGRWFHDIGGREKANDLIHDLWLERPAVETFGGNYGDASPPVGYTFAEAEGATLTVSPDTSPGPANHLSLHTLAEALRRLVLHREEPHQRLPGIQWLDLRVLLYGAEDPAKYGPWGGMTRDTAIYLQAGHDMDYIEARSQGQWTIFSKLGLGSQGQFVHLGYACWPVLDGGDVVPGQGREFVIAAHLDQGGTDWDERDRILATAYRKVILRIVDGRL